MPIFSQVIIVSVSMAKGSSRSASEYKKFIYCKGNGEHYLSIPEGNDGQFENIQVAKRQLQTEQIQKLL